MSLPSSEVTTRLYRLSDQPGVEWLYARTPPWGRTYPRPQPIPEDIERVGERFECVLVAVEQDRDGEAVIGLTAVNNANAGNEFVVPDFLELTETTARLHHVLVAPERWRQGVGRRLIKQAVDYSRQRGYRTLILDTTADQTGAVNFYLALGFRVAGRTVHRDWEIVWFALDL